MNTDSVLKRANPKGASIVDELGTNRFVIEMPIHAHARCLAKCIEKSPDYALLRNAIILRDDPQKVMVQLRCEADKAREIQRIVARECPVFLDELQIYPDPVMPHRG